VTISGSSLPHLCSVFCSTQSSSLVILLNHQRHLVYRSVLQLCSMLHLECTAGSLHEPRSTVDSPRLARIRSSSNVNSPLSPSITPWLLHSWCITACFTNTFHSRLSSSFTQDCFRGLILGLDLRWSIFVFFSVFHYQYYSVIPCSRWSWLPDRYLAHAKQSLSLLNHLNLIALQLSSHIWHEFNIHVSLCGVSLPTLGINVTVHHWKLVTYWA